MPTSRRMPAYCFSVTVRGELQAKESAPAGRRSRCYGRLLPGGMHQGEHPDRVLLDLVDQAVELLCTTASRVPGMRPVRPILRMISEPGSGLAEQIVHLDGGTRAVGGDVIEDLGAVVFRLGRPADFHDSVTFLAAAVRRAANVASTSSFERPRPARIVLSAECSMVSVGKFHERHPFCLRPSNDWEVRWPIAVPPRLPRRPTKGRCRFGERRGEEP